MDSCEPAHLKCSAPSGVIDPSGQWVCRVEAMGERHFVYAIDLETGAGV